MLNVEATHYDESYENRIHGACAELFMAESMCLMGGGFEKPDFEGILRRYFRDENKEMN